MIFVPETLILNTFTGLINFLNRDFRESVDKSQSYIGKLLYSPSKSIDRYNLFEQASRVFGYESDYPRKINVNMFFNTQMAHMPSIHLMMAGDQEQTGGEGIGMDEGYREPISTLLEDESGRIFGETITKVFSRRYRGSYNIVVTSDNSNEVVLMYNVLKACSVALTQSLVLSGLEMVRLSGSDININPSLIPKNVHARSLTLSYEYDFDVPSLFTVEQFNSWNFEGTVNLK